MSDGECGAFFGDATQRPLHNAFRMRINVGGGFIENEDTRAGQYRPSKTDKLPLPSAEIVAALSYRCIVAFFKTVDKGMGSHRFGDLGYFLIGSIRFTVFNIIPDGTGEEYGVLGHYAYLLS